VASNYQAGQDRERVGAAEAGRTKNYLKGMAAVSARQICLSWAFSDVTEIGARMTHCVTALRPKACGYEANEKGRESKPPGLSGHLSVITDQTSAAALLTTPWAGCKR